MSFNDDPLIKLIQLDQSAGDQKKSESSNLLPINDYLYASSLVIENAVDTNLQSLKSS